MTGHPLASHIAVVPKEPQTTLEAATVVRKHLMAALGVGEKDVIAALGNSTTEPHLVVWVRDLPAAKFEDILTKLSGIMPAAGKTSTRHWVFLAQSSVPGDPYFNFSVTYQR